MPTIEVYRPSTYQNRVSSALTLTAALYARPDSFFFWGSYQFSGILTRLFIYSLDTDHTGACNVIPIWTVFYFLLSLGTQQTNRECLTFEMRPVPRSTAGTVRRICQASLPLLMYLCVTAYYSCISVQIYILKECRHI